MSITQQQIELVSESFQKVIPIAELAAELFYHRLFEIAPETEALFEKTRIKEQGNKLMSTVGAAVAGLRNIDDLVPIIKKLGARHVNYHVTDEMYQPVGEALLWTLGQGLGEAFTGEVEDAWATVYGIIAETAIAGAHEAMAEKEPF